MRKTHKATLFALMQILIANVLLGGCSEKPQTNIAEKSQLANLHVSNKDDSLLISGGVKMEGGLCFDKLNFEYIEDRKLRILIYLRQTRKKEEENKTTPFSASIPLKQVDEIFLGKSKTLLWKSPADGDSSNRNQPPIAINYKQLYHFIRNCYTNVNDHFYMTEYEWQPQPDSSITIYDWHERKEVAIIKNDLIHPITQQKGEANFLKSHIRLQAESLYRFFHKPYRIFQSQAIRYQEKVFGECGLSEDELLLLDELIQRGVNQFNRDETRRKGQSVSSGNATQEIFLQRYRRQYVPYINEEGKKMTWVACYDVTINGGSEIRKLCRLGEGGNNYFNVTINLTDKKVEAMVINKY